MIHECPELRDRIHVFRDRAHAGQVLAGLLEGEVPAEATVLAVPAGGVPVAAELARALRLPLDVAVVSKVTLPWNTEVGYGAVAFDGTVQLNEPLVAHFGLDPETVRRGVEATRARVARRVAELRPASRAGAPFAAPPVAVVVDDGLASGFTMRTAVAAVRSAGCARLLVAVPTASLRAARELEPRVEAVFCANLRTGASFAVADAYERWSDVSEREAARLLAAADAS